MRVGVQVGYLSQGRTIPLLPPGREELVGCSTVLFMSKSLNAPGKEFRLPVLILLRDDGQR